MLKMKILPPRLFSLLALLAVLMPVARPLPARGAGPPSDTTHVHSLDEAAKALHSPSGKRIFSEQMAGTTSKLEFNEIDVKNAAKDQLVKTMLPGALWTQFGAKIDSKMSLPRPGHPGQYICAIHVNNEGSGQPAAGSSGYLVALCQKQTDKSEFTLLAELSAPFEPTCNWHAAFTEDQGPTDDRLSGKPFKIDATDCKLVDSGDTFAIRCQFFEGYAGGGGTWETLNIFSQERDRLHLILTAPISAVKMTAGDWNKDQTRQHDMAEVEYEVTSLPNKVGNFHDALIRQKAGGHKRFNALWNASKQSYVVSKVAKGLKK